MISWTVPLTWENWREWGSCGEDILKALRVSWTRSDNQEDERSIHVDEFFGTYIDLFL
jgi:hypothetical protein